MYQLKVLWAPKRPLRNHPGRRRLQTAVASAIPLNLRSLNRPWRLDLGARRTRIYSTINLSRTARRPYEHEHRQSVTSLHDSTTPRPNLQTPRVINKLAETTRVSVSVTSACFRPLWGISPTMVQKIIYRLTRSHRKSVRCHLSPVGSFFNKQQGVRCSFFLSVRLFFVSQPLTPFLLNVPIKYDTCFVCVVAAHFVCQLFNRPYVRV